jgi:hypothetical protein
MHPGCAWATAVPRQRNGPAREAAGVRLEMARRSGSRTCDGHRYRRVLRVGAQTRRHRGAGLRERLSGRRCACPVLCYSTNGTCKRSTRTRYKLLGATIEHDISWYRFFESPRKLLAAPVGLSVDGHVMLIAAQTTIEWDGTYRDAVLDETQGANVLMFHAIGMDGHASVLVFDSESNVRRTVPVKIRPAVNALNPPRCNE